jgi:hypothetical protein
MIMESPRAEAELAASWDAVHDQLPEMSVIADASEARAANRSLIDASPVCIEQHQLGIDQESRVRGP